MSKILKNAKTHKCQFRDYLKTDLLVAVYNKKHAKKRASYVPREIVRDESICLPGAQSAKRGYVDWG